ncbi:SDR family NAD(P)-dependent oxidoreductase [Pelagerythrobacter rhizovicinus]|uniref:SDR family NAD(P)-dependent oxidoreductase n=1 Tax=Pelagerythrobacter rhizovicinus TaxID=2268576 RepID=A0A4Q2KJM1_9SPHN|nr:SDR family NAD(P)-dependent oxidoreductase [Pelagerythrobacter rhizovicinus]RXZ65425.1 SDR family NAD(P)-dependent oxidoreductase [Pelagerythrobacter rhizovicinus]
MMPPAAQTILVTGGAGFIGCNLADRLAERGYRVRILDSLARPGVETNLQWLTERHGERIEPVTSDLRDEETASRAAREVHGAFHFAAQVAVTTSLDDPRADFDANLRGTFNLLEALRTTDGGVPLIFASTNKVYGNLPDLQFGPGTNGYEPADAQLAQFGLDETRPLDFHTPYGCSKGAADQYVLDYSRSFGMRTAVIRMSCIYGERQLGTEDQGWVAHFLISAMEGRPITLFGDGWQVRDVCTVDDTCDMYLAALDRIDAISGRAFNWGGGPTNAVSLRAVLDEIGVILDSKPHFEVEGWRAGDQRWFVADTRAIDTALQLPPRTDWRKGLRALSDWLASEREFAASAIELSSQKVAAL